MKICKLFILQKVGNEIFCKKIQCIGYLMNQIDKFTMVIKPYPVRFHSIFLIQPESWSITLII